MGTSDWFKRLRGWFSSHEEQPARIEFVKAWELTVVGRITAWKKLNVDKSGRNPRYHVYGVIEVHDSELLHAEFEVPVSINFQGKEADLQAGDHAPISVGDTVKLLFKGTAAPQGRMVLYKIIPHA